MSEERSAGTPSDLPLTGVRVIDLTRILAGPYATQILGDHGAKIIKVEPPQGDDTRDWGPPFVTGDDGAIISSAYFQGANRNKRGLSLDLAQGEGCAVLLKLLGGADILIENFKTGTMERWGLDYERDLAPRFPRLIYAQISGFGADGPLGGFPGYDAVAQAMTGLMSVNASPATGAMRVGVPIVDIAAGMNAALGLLMALEARHRTGRGRRVDVNLYDTGLSLIHPQAANWLMGALAPVSMGNAHPNIAPYDRFETATGAIFLGAGNDRQFDKACEIFGATQLASDPRFATNRLRSENRAALRPLLEALFADKDAHALEAQFLEAGVPAGAVASLEAALAAPHTKHSGMVIEAPPYRGVASPIRTGGERGASLRAPPRFAEHTDEVLREVGYTPEEIAALVSRGAVITTRRL
jgi:formyl-CoA transferase